MEDFKTDYRAGICFRNPAATSMVRYVIHTPKEIKYDNPKRTLGIWLHVLYYFLFPIVWLTPITLCAGVNVVIYYTTGYSDPLLGIMFGMIALLFTLMLQYWMADVKDKLPSPRKYLIRYE